MATIKKGIILAGGSGSRLYPLTSIVSKQLQPVYDKPMVYYPLTTLLENRVSELCLISSEDQLPHYKKLLGDGSRFGASIEYLVQPKPEGIAQAFLIAEKFIANDPVTLMLGDNIFHGSSYFSPAFKDFEGGGVIFAAPVQNPERYGVVEFSAKGEVLSMVEKPKNPKSNYAIPGLYVYDAHVVELTRKLRPSARGELEITELNQMYLDRKALKVVRLSRGFAWLDAGTSSSLHDASTYVETLEKRQGIKIGCPEEAALRSGLINAVHFRQLVDAMPACEYRDYLERVAAQAPAA
jgi:glucose-1-phosphate thymidylyltransferase